MSKQEKITLTDGEGKEVTITLAPTPIAVLAKHAATFAKGKAADNIEALEAILECVAASAKRAKQGGATIEWLRENVDSYNMDAVAKAFRDVNGFPDAKDEGAPSGEAAAAGAT